MTSLMVKIFIFILHLYISPIINAENTELGQSSCRYAGNIDPKGITCNGQDVIPLDNLPKDECKSYVYDGVTCLDDFSIEPSYYAYDLDNIRSLTTFSKKVFLLYGRQNYLTSWTRDDFYDGIKTEGQNLKTFIQDYPVAGLILTGINSPINVSTNDYYTRFQSYITLLRINNLNLKIGLYLNASTMILNKNDKQWFDFSKINLIMDYYLITFHGFNDCTEKLLNGGTTPMDSNDPNINTLNKFADALSVSNIAKEKVYFEFVITPSIPFANVPTTLHCDISYYEYCKNNHTDWCVDNQKTFSEKGLFAKKYARGWVGSDIDLVDRDVACKCNGDKFISFHMILDAYNEKEMKTCDKLKETAIGWSNRLKNIF